MRLQYIMYEIRKSETFAKWLDNLCDIHARARTQVADIKIALRLARDL